MQFSRFYSNKNACFASLFCLFLMGSMPVFAQTNGYFPPLTGATWQTVSPASLGWCQDKLDSVQNYLGAHNTKACIILKDGKIAAEWYYGNFTKDSLHYWASAGKTITGLLVGVAQQDGILSINDSTSRFLGTGWTSETPTKERLITIKNNLSMTTGLDDGVPDDNCTSPSCLLYKADAGMRWAYHNAPYHLLQDLVASASGITYQQYTTQKLKQKTGMDGIWVNYIYYSTARSMARFGLLLLNKGKWNTTPVLSDTAYFRQMTTSSNPYNLSYGYLTWLNGKPSCMLPTSQFVFQQSLIPSAPADMFCALGKNDQKVYVVPSQKLVVIRMGESATSQALALSAFDEPLWQRINQLACVSTDNANSTAIQSNSISVFPNPAETILTLKNTQNSENITNITIYNTLGQRVICFNNINETQKTIDIKMLEKGVYFAEIKLENSSTRIKFLHQ